MLLGQYLSLLHRSQSQLAEAFDAVGQAFTDEAEIERGASRLATQCRRHAEQLRPFVDHYRDDETDEPSDLHSDLFHGPRSGPLGLLRDLHDLYLMTAECDIVWTLVGQAAQGARDRELLGVVHECEQETTIQMKWCQTQLKQRAPQVLVVAR